MSLYNFARDIVIKGIRHYLVYGEKHPDYYVTYFDGESWVGTKTFIIRVDDRIAIIARICLEKRILCDTVRSIQDHFILNPWEECSYQKLLFVDDRVYINGCMCTVVLPVKPIAHAGHKSIIRFTDNIYMPVAVYDDEVFSYGNNARAYIFKIKEACNDL